MDNDEEAAGQKPGMPEKFRLLGEEAIRRHQRRPATPELVVYTKKGRWGVGSPYHERHEDHWTALMFEAFGTRSGATFDIFISQLSALCSTDWDEPSSAWFPNENELIAAVQILRSTKPRNEAEACLAAQMVAVHLMQMKLSAQVMKRDWPDARTCAIAAKLARTYAMQLETMAKLKGRGSRQRITVRKYSKHEHKHIHLHQGGPENGNQAHEPKRSREPQVKEASEPAASAALPCNDSSWNALPMPCGQREKALSNARRR